MRSFQQYLQEAQTRTFAFTFGRFQPPTIGHEALLEALRAHARNDSFRIFPTHTVDRKTNLLPFSEKVEILRLAFPRFTNQIESSPDGPKTIIEVAQWVNSHRKYSQNLLMVVGSDRVEHFQKLLDQYNGKEYEFESIEVVSAGERDPDADGAQGASSSKARVFAQQGDLKKFSALMPKTLPTEVTQELFNLFGGT